MIINTLPLRKYQRFLETVVEKGQQQYEAVCLDTKNKKIRFHTSRVRGDLDLEIEFEAGEAPLPYLYFDTVKFFAFVREYESLNLKDDYTFHLNDGDGNLAPLVIEDETFEAFDPSLMTDQFPLKLSGSSTDPLLRYLQAAASFAPADIESPYCGVFVQADRVVSGDRHLFYERLLENKDESSIEFDMPLWGIDLIKQLPFDQVEVGLTDHHFILSSEEDNFLCRVSKSTNLSAHPVTDPEFIAAYTFPAGIVLLRQALLDQLRFFKPFVKDSPNLRLEIRIEKDELFLGVVSLDKKSAINRHFPVSLTDESIIGTTYQVNSDFLAKVLNMFETEFVQLLTNQTSPIINVVGMKSDAIDPSLHIIVTKLKV